MLHLLESEWSASIIEDLTAEEIKLSLLINLRAVKKPIDESVYKKYPKIKYSFLTNIEYKHFEKIYSNELKFYKLIISLINKEVIVRIDKNLYEMSAWMFGDRNKIKTPLMDILNDLNAGL